jgi:hypothetical protein
MEVWKNWRFWVTALAMGIVGGMGFSGAVSGEASMAAVLGIAGGGVAWGLGSKKAK